MSEQFDEAAFTKLGWIVALIAGMALLHGKIASDNAPRYMGRDGAYDVYCGAVSAPDPLGVGVDYDCWHVPADYYRKN